MFLQIAWGNSSLFLLSCGSHTCLSPGFRVTPSGKTTKQNKNPSSLFPLGGSVFKGFGEDQGGGCPLARQNNSPKMK